MMSRIEVLKSKITNITKITNPFAYIMDKSNRTVNVD
jgi:hypothetical protein